MPVAWFITPYKRRAWPSGGKLVAFRYCAMDDYTEKIIADGGSWSETEVLGDRAIVKVRASASVLAQIIGQDFWRLPKAQLSDSLADVDSAEINALRSQILNMGYSSQEINAALPGNWDQYTLGDILDFAATRRLKPQYDKATDQIILDGPIQPCKSIQTVDREVKE